MKLIAPLLVGSLALAAVLSFPAPARAGDAPAWMHALVNVPLPEHDEKADAVMLYSEKILIVEAKGKTRTIERGAYKILRPSGDKYGTVVVTFTPDSKIRNLKAWCIPAQGKDYEVKEKEAIETGLVGYEEGVLIEDIREKTLRVPAAEPGNIVGYEVEQDEHPYVFQEFWGFQETIPVREARFTIQLPQDWEYKAAWMNAEEVKPTPSGNNQWTWVVQNVKAVRPEPDMPPLRAVMARMVISIIPPGSSLKKGFVDWSETGKWEASLSEGRRDASPEIKQKVAELTASAKTPLEKMQALAQFVQKDIRYVAVELGIGGWQPHPARDIYAHRYGDCKDKATLMGSMLKEVGLDSYYIVINTSRGGVNSSTPATPFWFNHAILGVKLPEDVKDPSLRAIYQHPKYGRILIFDPTDEITPFGDLRGPLQDNYGLLVTPDGGDLIDLPMLPPSLSGVHRIGKFHLASNGALTGDITELHYGDDARHSRGFLQSTTKSEDRIKYIETTLSHSLSNYRVTKASIGDEKRYNMPLQFIYSFAADQYAKPAGQMLLVRPRVIGSETMGLLETKEPRKFPVEFEGPSIDVDSYEITLPPGWEVLDLPAPVNLEYEFGSYHSKSEVKDGVLHYTRTTEIKKPSVPVKNLDELKNFFRVISGDERNSALLKPAN